MNEDENFPSLAAEQLLVLNPSAVSVPVIGGVAIAIRDELLGLAQTVSEVKTPESAAEVLRVMREIKSFLEKIEARRKIVKEPIIELGKSIDAAAKDLALELGIETARLNRLLGAWNEAQRRIEEDRKKRAREEEDRILREKADALAKAEAKAKTDASFDKAAAKIETKASVEIGIARTNYVAAQDTRMKGVTTRTNYMFEITNIDELEKAYPMLIVRSVNEQLLKGMIRTLDSKSGGAPAIPGVRWWKEAVSSVRSS